MVEELLLLRGALGHPDARPLARALGRQVDHAADASKRLQQGIQSLLEANPPRLPV